MMSAKRLSFYCSFFLLFFTARLQGQIRCKLEHYSTEDGLSHDGVMSMIKDHEGFMWFGTWDGINRFDGHTFVTYKARPGDTSSLKNNRIDNIVEDKAGYLWIKAYNNQIYRFDKKTEQFLAISSLFKDPKLKSTVFDKIIAASNGDVWLTTTNQGIFYVQNSVASLPIITQFAQNLKADNHIPSNHFNFIFEDKNTHIWIGTPEGLCYFEQDSTSTYKLKKLNTAYTDHFNFTSVAEGAGKMWFGTAQGSLLSYSKNNREFSARQITQHKINGVLVSHDKKNIYASTSNTELINIDIANKNIATYTMPGTEAFYSLHEDRSGIIWVEPAKHGIIRFKPIDKTFKYFFQKNDATFYNPAKAYSVFEDYTGVVWIRMKGGGFGYYNPVTDNIDYFHDQPGSADRLFSNIVTCKYMDPSGILWLSSNDRGINKIIFQRNDFNQKLVVEHSINKSDNDIRAIYNDHKNRLWMASKSGKLYVYQNDKQLANVIENEPVEGLGVIYTIMQDQSGNVWMGTKGNGLFKAEPVNKDQSRYKLTHYLSVPNDKNSLSSNLIYSLYEDNEGRIWVGTYEQGLNVITTQNGQTKFLNNKTSFINYPKDAFNKIRNLQQDVSGNLWVTTTDGLLIIDLQHDNLKTCAISTYHKNPGDKGSLGNNNIQYIFRDSHNTMWLATSGGGLNKAIGQHPLKSLTFKVLTMADGLPNDYILSCAEDNKGNLWLATEKGLSEFNPANNRFRNFDSYDGLPKAGFSEASNIKLADGKLIFGSTNGYISFYPDKIINRRTEAKMAFTNLQVNNEDVKVNSKDSLLKSNINNTQNIVLRHNQNIVSIDYALLDFRSGNKQTYAYRLKGFDTVWHNNQNQRRATYTNLPPGKYTFEVKSLNNDLYVSVPEKSLAITILPPPWKTWWAYTLYLIFTVIIIEAVRRTALTMLRLRHRISVEQKLGEMKLSFFTNISHELRTPLTLILNPIEEIFLKEKLSAQGNAYINVVRKNANRMVRFINQLLDLRKLQSGKSTLKIARVEIISFLHKINEYFVDVAREKEITVTIVSTVNELYAWIDADKIDIVIYNLLANAFKFSPKGTSIKIEINKINDDLLTIAVKDEGFGVANEQIGNIFKLYYEADNAESSNLKGTGIGLALSKELVLLHHGNIFAKNNADKGLTVTVELKTGKEHFNIDEVSFVEAPAETREAEHQIAESENQSLLVKETSQPSNMPLILLVEDNTDLRNFLVIQLSELYTVEEATNGEEGLEKAIRLLPDLVLSDVMMPKMDGIQMLDQLKNNLKTSHIPVILLSAKFSVENQIEGLKYGADYYITKPFQNDFLLASIENLLKQRKKIFEAMLPDTKTITLKPGEIVITSKDELFLKEIIHIVECGMSDPNFNIDTVAESIGMGRTTFYKKFKSLTNQPPVEFVRDMRLIRSMQMLDAGESSVSEIGYAVGFNSVGYFGKCFKEKYHISPSEYLKAHNLEKHVKI